MAEITGPPGTDDTIAPTVEAAVTAGMGHARHAEQDTLTAGDTIGDVADLPPNPVSANYGSALGADSGQVQVPAQQGGSPS